MLLGDITLKSDIKYLFLFFLILLSCGKNHKDYGKNVFPYSGFPQEKELRGEVIELDTALFRYPFRIRIKGDKAIVMDLHGSEYYGHLFQYPSFRYLSSFGRRGDSPTEMLSMENFRLCNHELWTLDANKSELTRLDFSSSGDSLLREETVTLDEDILRPLDFAVYDDTTFIIPDYSGESRFLKYEYIGSSEQGHKLLKKDLEEFNELLPMGYTAKSEDNNWSWGGKDNKQYRLLLIVIAIIFFITSILFNSLKQPLAIIFVIPVSYIGVFLTFYWFKLNFDQGGFASFVLLCGITVNASIYILNEYNSIRKRFPRLSPLRAYVKAWNTKIIPIFLTVTSTILGFIPFMVGAEKEGFWFPLAAGTIGGLIMSVVGVFIFLPVLTLKKKHCFVSSKAML